MFDLPSLLTDFEVNVVVGAVSLTCGVLFATKITDFFKGIPTDLRTGLKAVETDALAKVTAAKASVIATLPGVPAAPAPVAKVAVAAAPAPAAAAAAPAPAA